MRGRDLQRAVVEHQRAFVAGATSGHVAAGKEPTRPSDQILLDLVTSSANGLLIAAGNRQRAPAGDDLGERITQSRLVDYRPNVLGKGGADTFTQREVFQFGIRLTQRGAMPVAPGDEEDFAVIIETKGDAAFARDSAEAVLRVDIANAVDRRHLEAGLAGVGIKRERSGPDDGMVSHALGRFKVALDI